MPNHIKCKIFNFKPNISDYLDKVKMVNEGLLCIVETFSDEISAPYVGSSN